jgi:hypothetical protein
VSTTSILHNRSLPCGAIDIEELTHMQMTGSGGILSVPDEHLPGLVALIAVPLVLLVAWLTVRALASRNVHWAEAARRGFDQLSSPARVTLFGVLIGAIVHVALVPTHWSDAHNVALLFIVDTVGFAVAIAWILLRRRNWAAVSAAMLLGTVAVYAWYLLTGREDPDLVGLLTTGVELAAGLVAASAMVWNHTDASRTRGPRWVVVTAGAVVLALGGMSAVAAASPTSTSSDAAGTSSTDTAGTTGMAGMAGWSTSEHPLSLTTTSPAGAIAWPDDMSNMAPGMRMATGDCTAQPTAAEQRAAVQLVNQTVAAVAPYRSLAAAKAAGYVPVTPSGKKIVHYINPSIYREHATLDPREVPVLVYVNTDRGAVLSAAMYLMPRTAASNPPQPGGCLTQWHVHTDLCFNGGGVVGRTNAGGCGAGSVNLATSPMMHVWMTPVSGGPLAPDPPKLDEVAAARQVAPTSPVNGIA